MPRIMIDLARGRRVAMRVAFGDLDLFRRCGAERIEDVQVEKTRYRTRASREKPWLARVPGCHQTAPSEPVVLLPVCEQAVVRGSVIGQKPNTACCATPKHSVARLEVGNLM